MQHTHAHVQTHRTAMMVLAFVALLFDDTAAAAKQTAEAEQDWYCWWLLRSFMSLVLAWFLHLDIGKWAQTRSTRKRYNADTERARKERDDKQHRVLLEEIPEQEWRPMSAIETSRKVRSGELSAVTNVINLAHRCRNVGRKYGAIAEELYDLAAAQAASLPSLDESSASPLFGVTISVKESLGVKDCYATGGLACRLRSRQTVDSLAVSVLRNSGVIPLCTGNIMQLMMLPESDNRIWGRVENPYDRTRVAGGSSGGEAALVALRCVPLAFGSDVAGSIRIPASSCGVTGFKPTSQRVSSKGVMRPKKNNRNGQSIAIAASEGPIALTVDDCAALMKTLWVPQLFQGDRNIPHSPFDNKEFEMKRKFKIAYFKSDKWFEPCVTTKRALDETIFGLQRRGHECTEISPPTDGWFNYGLLVALNTAEGQMRSFKEALEGEAFMPHYNTLYLAQILPNFVRSIALRVLDSRRAHLLSQGKRSGCGAYELWQKTADLLEMRSKWSDAIEGYDAIVHPSVPIPAPPHGMTGDITAAYSYMFIANLLDWAAGAVPVTTVRDNETHYNNCPFSDFYSKKIRDHVMPGSAGMPMSVMVMTGAYEDETCLAVMKEVENAVTFKAIPPDLL